MTGDGLSSHETCGQFPADELNDPERSTRRPAAASEPPSSPAAETTAPPAATGPAQ
jgi:hypothetical protein